MKNDSLKYLKLGVVVLVFGLLGYFLGGVFIDLVTNLYHWLDSFGHFFAGFIAFFGAIWLTMLMIEITIVGYWVIVVLIGVISEIYLKFKG